MRKTRFQKEKELITEFTPTDWTTCENCFDDIRGEPMYAQRYWTIHTCRKGALRFYCKKCYPTTEDLIKERL